MVDPVCVFIIFFIDDIELLFIIILYIKKKLRNFNFNNIFLK